ncbi:MAG: hypothetical protein DRP20_00865 [Thermotogae bacterium]|nr:MAG: hypothetical protein DRP20_00865 [Thermotogota bacterium]
MERGLEISRRYFKRGVIMEFLSNILFFSASGVLLFAVLSFELGLKAMRKDEKEKMSRHNRRGLKAIALCSIMFTVSLLIAFLL